MGILPTYSSGVDINRTDLGWRQTLDIDALLGPVRGENNWNLTVKDNPAQNNLRSRNGRGLAKLAYEVEGGGGWASGAQFDWRRNFTRGDFNRTVDNGTNAGLFVTSETPGLLLRPLLAGRDSTRTASWIVTGSFGATEGKNVRQTRGRAAGNPLQTQDSTATDGVTRNLESQLHLDAARGLTIDLTGSLASVRENSRTESRNASWRNEDLEAVPDSVLVTDTPNRSRSRRATARASYRPGDRLEFTMNGAATRDRSQYFSATNRGQETKVGLDDRLELLLRAEPMRGVKVSSTARQQKTDIALTLDPNDAGKEETYVDADIAFKTGQRFGYLRDLQIEAEAGATDTRYARETLADYDGENRRVRALVRRNIGKRVVAAVTGESQIDRLSYDDKSQDRDELRLLGDANIGYRPNAKADTRLSFQFTQRQAINIPAAQASSNLTESIYRIEAKLGYKLTPAVEISQTYSIYAVASEFDFNENNNQLSRTSEVKSRLISSLTPKLRLELDHDYRFRDSGSYLLDRTTNVRGYGRAATEDYQVFSVRTYYDLTEWFELTGGQKFEVRENTTLANGRVTRTERVEFIGGGDIRHTLSEGFSVDGNARWTQTSAEKPYWKISFRMTRSY